jgi:hypothetical protein
VSTLSLDSSVSLFEPAVARLAPAPVPARRQAAPRVTRPTPAPEAPQHSVTTASPGRHGRRRVSSARRASATSTLNPAVVARSVRLVALRALGTGAAAASLTIALAVSSTNSGSRQALLASLSVRGLAFAAILCAAWGFQDRSRLGTLATTRAWYGTAVVLGLAHAAWLESTMPGPWNAHLGTSLESFALDVVLVAVPALLGSRAGRPETPEICSRG